MFFSPPAFESFSCEISPSARSSLSVASSPRFHFVATRFILSLPIPTLWQPVRRRTVRDCHVGSAQSALGHGTFAGRSIGFAFRSFCIERLAQSISAGPAQPRFCRSFAFGRLCRNRSGHNSVTPAGSSTPGRSIAADIQRFGGSAEQSPLP